MAKFPRKPRTGQKTIQALYRSVNEIIDYLPSLTVRGDGKTTSVSNTSEGSIVHVKSNNKSNWKYQGDYQKYVFGEGVKSVYDETIISGMSGVAKQLLPQYVTLNISGDNQYISAYYPTTDEGSIRAPVVIKYIGPTPSGGGGGGSGGTVNLYAGNGISITGTNNSYTISSNIVPGRCIGTQLVHYDFYNQTGDTYYLISSTIIGDSQVNSPAPIPGGEPPSPWYYNNTRSIRVNQTYGNMGWSTIEIVNLSAHISAGMGLVSGYEDIYTKGSNGEDASPKVWYRTVTQVGLQQDFYYDLCAISGRNNSGDYILSSHNGALSWQVNSGGGGGTTYTAGSGINITNQDVIQTSFQPGYSMWFWYHDGDEYGPPYITIQNGLSAGFGITYRDNNPVQGDYHMKYIDVNLKGGDYISVITGTSTSNGTTVHDNYPTIRCNLSATGYLGLSTVSVGEYDTGAIITTNLHGDNETITILNDGTLSCLVEGGTGQTLSAGSGVVIYTSGGNEYIRTNLEPGCDIWFWDHNQDTYPTDRITIENGLSAGHGITFRSNYTPPQGDQTWTDPNDMHLIDVNISGGQWLEYNVSAATMSCTLTGDNQTVFINEQGVISARMQESQWTSLTPSLLAVNNNDHTLSAATPSGSGGGGGGDLTWPNYRNLVSGMGEEPGHVTVFDDANMVYTQKTYVSTGGWLRVSIKGSTGGKCCGIWINKTTQDNGYHIGMWGGGAGNTWIWPIKAGDTFYIEFPQDSCQCYFDSDCYDGDTYDPEDQSTWIPAKHSPANEQKVYVIRGYKESAYDKMNQANSQRYDAEEQYDYASDNWGYYPDDPDYFEDKDWYEYRKDEASGYAANAQDYADVATGCVISAQTLYATLDDISKSKASAYISGYVDLSDSSNNISGAIHYARQAQQQANQAAEWALSCKWFYDHYPTS